MRIGKKTGFISDLALMIVSLMTISVSDSRKHPLSRVSLDLLIKANGAFEEKVFVFRTTGEKRLP